jgi:hypothetical protein
LFDPGQFHAALAPKLNSIGIARTAEPAVGNDFLDDWDTWAALTATDGWLVFEPNYRKNWGGRGKYFHTRKVDEGVGFAAFGFSEEAFEIPEESFVLGEAELGAGGGGVRRTEPVEYIVLLDEEVFYGGGAAEADVGFG